MPARSRGLYDLRDKPGLLVAIAKAEINTRHRSQRNALQALIAAEFASKFADAMQAGPEERNAIIARLEQEQAARLEAALMECEQAAAEAKKAVIGSHSYAHRFRAKRLHNRDFENRRPFRVERRRFLSRAPG